MKYHAKDLQAIYEILETFPKPLAVLDFFCGEVGCEFGAAQCLGGQFYDKHQKSVRVVALCWEGASLLYTNVSDDQIEFTDWAQSRSGDKRHDGARKFRWLARREHKKRVGKIEGIMAHCGPHDVSEKAMTKQYGLHSGKQWEMIRERLVHTEFVFPSGERPIEDPYIALFDRTEKHQPERNTRRWQINLFRWWAHEFGLRLAVISGFYPRSQPDDVICFSFYRRNFDLLCNVIRHSVLYASPPSGAGDAGLVFGCNLVALGTWSRRTKDIMPGLSTGRGFQHFGTLTEPDGEVANKVREYLKKKMK